MHFLSTFSRWDSSVERRCSKAGHYERLPQLEPARILPKDKIVYAHCASRRRCLLAADILKEQGYDVRALTSGYKALVLKGFVKANE